MMMETVLSRSIRLVCAGGLMLGVQAANAMLQDYYRAMRKVSIKKVRGVQMEWLPAITAKYGGTYAAEVATMIRTASRLDEEK